ncbi:MAG: FkbM family methyltransferase [Alphaproteobacteria bacterium]|nr:FkbM family methyltransferase [Alphaproteobacteria bacterium]
MAMESIDERRKITNRHGFYTMRMGNSLERWRMDTVLTKEPETIDWLDRTIESGSVFYDVGANIGVYSLYALHIHPGSVSAVCFEPEALNFARLNQNLNDNGFSERATPFAIGLGTGDAVIDFRLKGLQAGGALHGDRHVPPGQHQHRQGLVIKSLDAVLAAAPGLPRPTHLKIDVDGPELDILRGAGETLRMDSLRHLLVELEQNEREEADGLLAEFGFKPVLEGRLEGTMRNVIYRKDAP